MVEKARAAGLPDLELTLSGALPQLFPGLRLLPAAARRTLEPTLARIRGAATHWTGDDHQHMFDLWEKGDTVGARLVNSRLLESFAFETGDDAPNPIPSKAMMRHLGIAVGQARLPMGDAPDFVEQRAPQVWANLQRWRDEFPLAPSR